MKTYNLSIGENGTLIKGTDKRAFESVLMGSIALGETHEEMKSWICAIIDTFETLPKVKEVEYRIWNKDHTSYQSETHASVDYQDYADLLRGLDLAARQTARGKTVKTLVGVDKAAYKVAITLADMVDKVVAKALRREMKMKHVENINRIIEKMRRHEKWDAAEMLCS